MKCMQCRFGYSRFVTTDSKGCRVCKCRSACEDKKCPPGTTCVLTKRSHRFPWGAKLFGTSLSPICVETQVGTTEKPKTCPRPKCVRCSPGFRRVIVKDSKGCRVCKCRSLCEVCWSVVVFMQNSKL
ncbi:hypothetical protein NP493_316g02002 [Ridgeia piscesae]|uniref:Uncharacterized protein n=1 Tax=Ridgeia piscesae TaxID=27915 RepID=A0AAD9L5H1_RIDPI|nr:hypothetical protein NP493_316g02002 [Ridgeia piscesae]